MKISNCIVPIVCLLLIFSPHDVNSQETQKDIIETIQASWMEAESNAQDLEQFYSDNSGLMLHDELFTGTEQIREKILALTNKMGQLSHYDIIEVFQLRNNQKFVLGAYQTKSGMTLSSIIGWKKTVKWTKEFEVIYNNSDCNNLGKNAVNKARENWERYSNLHRPDLIVDNVFSKNGKYFNRGTLYEGKEIIDSYSYMYNESYKIKLEALSVSQVNCDITYDIGTFEAGGKGLYTLIWKKEVDTWRLLLDFNF